MRGDSAPADEVDDFDHVVRDEFRRLVFSAWHDTAVAFDRYRALHQTQVVDQALHRKFIRYFAGLAIYR